MQRPREQSNTDRRTPDRQAAARQQQQRRCTNIARRPWPLREGRRQMERRRTTAGLNTQSSHGWEQRQPRGLLQQQLQQAG